MIVRTAFAVSALLLPGLAATAHAQDVPGIEICTVEKTMERRTSCLQSNVDFLMRTINKLAADHQQKIVDDLQAAQKKVAGDQNKADAPPAKDNAAPAKDGAK